MEDSPHVQNIMKRLRAFFLNNRYPIALVAIILLSIYPLSLYLFIPKWDNVIAYLPYRFFISDYIWNGHLPLWNPFQRMGYPGYADLQSGCWYPVAWLIMLFGKYDITSLMVELQVCFVFAGLGMFTLAKQFFHCEKTAFICGLAYALSGFMTGSTQLMVFLTGVAWLPWCIWALYMFLETLQLRYVLYIALFFSLNITGASPAFTIMLVYITTGMVLWTLWKHRHEIEVILRILKRGSIGGIVLLVMLLPFIQSFIDFSPYFNRSGKLPYDAMILNPFTFRDYLSFVSPYTVISNTSFFSLTDLSLRNAYVGFFILLTFFLSFREFRSPNRTWLILLTGLVIALLLALGDESGMYQWIYHLPGFGLFRHPSFFRAYAILCLVLMSGYTLRGMFSRNAFNRAEKWALGAGILLVVAMFFVGWMNAPQGEIAENFREIVQRREFSKAGIFSHAAIQSLLLVLSAIIAVFFYRRFRSTVFAGISVFVVLDLFFQAFLTAPTTMHYPYRYEGVKTFFRSLPEQHNQSFNYTAFRELNDRQGLMSTPGIELNLATFNKALSCVGENPLRFKAFDAARDNGVLERNLENSLMYAPVKMLQPGDSLQPSVIWGIPEPLESDSTQAELSHVWVGYNTFSAQVTNNSRHSSWLVLNQNYHHLWKASLDGQTLPIFPVNEMVMGVRIPPHKSGELQFTYSSPGLVYWIGTSLLMYLLVVLALLLRWV